MNVLFSIYIFVCWNVLSVATTLLSFFYTNNIQISTLIYTCILVIYKISYKISKLWHWVSQISVYNCISSYSKYTSYCVSVEYGVWNKTFTSDANIHADRDRSFDSNILWLFNHFVLLCFAWISVENIYSRIYYYSENNSEAG